VNRLPTRVFGLLLLTVSLSVASCQAFVHSLPHVDETPAIDQRDIHGSSNGSSNEELRHELPRNT
jgi:hypothetical protein